MRRVAHFISLIAQMGLSHRIGRSYSSDLGVTGLGLSIVMHLMITYRVKMEIESQLGRGIKVSLFFPIQKV